MSKTRATNVQFRNSGGAKRDVPIRKPLTIPAIRERRFTTYFRTADLVRG
jgi:hypothetical protein